MSNGNPLEDLRLRIRLFIKYEKLTPGSTAGTYIVDLDESTRITLGTGAEIIVIDKPGMMLFWSADDQLAYDWTTGA